jgi:hypothetical protein
MRNLLNGVLARVGRQAWCQQLSGQSLTPGTQVEQVRQVDVADTTCNSTQLQVAAGSGAMIRTEVVADVVL